MKSIDTRGMSCPQPVLMTKKAIELKNNELEVIVDSNTAKENVQRFLQNASYQVSIEQKAETFILRATK